MEGHSIVLAWKSSRKDFGCFFFPTCFGYHSAPLVLLRPSLAMEVGKAVSTTEGENFDPEALDSYPWLMV